jgi:hypothetical protein
MQQIIFCQNKSSIRIELLNRMSYNKTSYNKPSYR